MRARRLLLVGSYVSLIYYSCISHILHTRSLQTNRCYILIGGRQRPKIHHGGISGKSLTLKSSHVPPASAVVAADWLRLDGGMET